MNSERAVMRLSFKLLGAVMLGAVGMATVDVLSVFAGPVGRSGASSLTSRNGWNAASSVEHANEHDNGNWRDSLEMITTDTGAFAPGNRNFTHYTSPAFCVEAAEEVAFAARRSLAAQREQYLLRQTAPERDTFPAEVRVAARRCGARFSVAQAASGELSALFKLALFMEDDSLARAVVRRQLAVGERNVKPMDLLARRVQQYLDAVPARFTEADWAATLADSIAQQARLDPYPVHKILLQFGRDHANWARTRRAAERTFAWERMPSAGHTAEGFYAVLRAYRALIAVAEFTQPDSLLTIAQRARAELRRYPQLTGSDLFREEAGIQPVVRDSSAQVVLQHLRPNPVQSGDLLAHLDGHPFPPLEAAYWFPAKLAPGWPPRGAVTLVIYDLACVHDIEVMLTGSFPTCSELLDRLLPEWLTQYGPRGLTVVMAEPMNGFAVRSGPLSPHAEADSIAAFYQHYLRLPVTVAVVPTVVRELVPPPDGRLVHADTTGLGKVERVDPIRAAGFPNPLVLLYGRDGTLLYGDEIKGWGVVEWAAGSKPQLSGFALLQLSIDRAVRTSSNTSSTTSPNPASGNAPSVPTP